jgi:hypothetical protein
VKKSLVYFAVLLLLLADAGYSFRQHYCQPLDGDMPGGIVPARDVGPVLSSPLGFKAIANGQLYPNPNRFFSHWTFYEYFNHVPFYLQKIVNPIDSLYLSGAIAKIIIQLMIIYLLAMAISGSGDLRKFDFIIAAGLIAPLFQANGYQPYMGIIDASTTYTFFYAWPAALLLLYFTPLFRQYYYGIKPAYPLVINILWVPLALACSLSGPLNPGVSLIISILIVCVMIANNYSRAINTKSYLRIKNAFLKVPQRCWLLLVPVALFSAYSLYLGKYNSISSDFSTPLGELYQRLPKGIADQLSFRAGFPFLLIIIIFNGLLIFFNRKNEEGKRILHLFTWTGIFILAYILLLPLGGYRNYRPGILRFDTILPVTLALFFIYGISTLFLLKNLSKKQSYWYIPLILIFLIKFTIEDRPRFTKNKCEKSALEEMSASRDAVYKIPGNCNVLSWQKITRPQDSELNAEFLFRMNVTREKKLYCNE